MRTHADPLRKGAAAAMLEHIIATANARSYQRLSLETGAQDSFAPARKLYERAGFSYCPPFEGYWDDPNSVFMTKVLA